MPGHALPSPDAIREIAHDLTEQGYEQAITVALSPTEQAPFLDAGFALHERLHLLTHDLAAVPSRIAPKPRRPRHDDWPGISATDTAAFSEFWQLGAEGLAQAMEATPVRRLRVVDDPDTGTIAGYVLTGRAGPTGYLQRLAVQPAMQGQGLGRAMTIDSLHWLRRHRCERAMVNTQITNERAFALYSSVGFVPDPRGLAVLKLSLSAGVPE